MNTPSSSNSSTVSLIRHVRAKDFSSALSSLLSAYGANGAAPSRPSTPQPKRSKTSEKFCSTIPTPSEPVTTSSSGRDWEASFARLQSQFGANGQAPCRPKVKSSSRTKTKRKEPRDLLDEEFDRLNLSARAPLHHSGHVGPNPIAPRGCL